MRRVALIFLGVILMMVTFAAGGCVNRAKAPAKVLDYLKVIKSYSLSYELVVKNDRQELKYSGRQFYDKNLGYRLELGEKRVQIYKENKIYVKDENNGAKYTLDEDFDALLRLTFFGDYLKQLYTNESIKTSAFSKDGKSYALIEMQLPGNNDNIARGVIYVEQKTCFPEYLLIYNKKGKEVIKITYSNFVPNEKLQKELFDVK